MASSVILILMEMFVVMLLEKCGAPGNVTTQSSTNTIEKVCNQILTVSCYSNVLAGYILRVKVCNQILTVSCCRNFAAGYIPLVKFYRSSLVCAGNINRGVGLKSVFQMLLAFRRWFLMLYLPCVFGVINDPPGSGFHDSVVLFAQFLAAVKYRSRYRNEVKRRRTNDAQKSFSNAGKLRQIPSTRKSVNIDGIIYIMRSSNRAR